MTITQKPSPNYSTQRASNINKVVIHWIYGNLAAADSVFSKPNSTSAHYGIEDNRVHQYVNTYHTAYHSGDWNMNLRSVGIEHSAHDNRPASEATYRTSGKLVREICERHNIPIDRIHIIKHSEVVPTRCPGTIDIDQIIRYAREKTGQPQEGGSMIPENISRKSSFFDRIWTDEHGPVDTDKVKGEQVDAFIKQAKDRSLGNHKFNLIANYLKKEPAKTTSEDVINIIASLQEELKTAKNKKATVRYTLAELLSAVWSKVKGIEVEL